jgi:hypothetical protein
MGMQQYRIAAVYDTETTNVGTGENTRAFPILYILNDIRKVDLREYVPDCEGEQVRFYRHGAEFLEALNGLIEWGRRAHAVPVVCAYNLMFDLQPVLYDLRQSFEMRACAQSSTNVYYLDLMQEGEAVLRFYDTFFLEMGGLAAMGNTCGFKKASGDWNYDLVRTPETPLTEQELFYAKRDVQVIPAYFRYLLEANEWLKPEELGNRVLTRTSLVRQQARHEVGSLRYMNRRGREVTLDFAFNKTCLQELPKTYAQHCLQKACFRGGFTFTSGKHAHEVRENVASLDVTSMHHLFLNGTKTPVHFRRMNHVYIQAIADRVVRTAPEYVMSHYDKPFNEAFHARIEFTNIRLKEGSAFEALGIALCPEGKFKGRPELISYGQKDEREHDAQLRIRAEGWHDSALRPVFAFGKLYKADAALIHVTEKELWCMAQVYSWDSMRVVLGEASFKFVTPPDYISLMSNILFERKSAAKYCLKHYQEGHANDWDIPDSIPPAIAEGMRAGTMSRAFLESWYSSTVKGAFNSLYGMEAQNVYKPDFLVDEGAELAIDPTTRANAANWQDMQPMNCKVLYTYGMRIVGGSRMHLILGIMLIHKAFGDRAQVLGGDTDSLKIACDPNISDEMLLNALEPLHIAARHAIATTQARIRRCFPKKASKLSTIGEFEVEKCEGSNRWQLHMECWNKARVSMSGGHSHVTCAGLSRPAGMYHAEHAIDELFARGLDFGTIVRSVVGYDSYISHDICHSLQRHRPLFVERYRGDVTDYLGNSAYVDSRQSIALYPVGRKLGETVKRSNAENVAYLRRLGREVSTADKFLLYDRQEKRPKLYIQTPEGVTEL